MSKYFGLIFISPIALCLGCGSSANPPQSGVGGSGSNSANISATSGGGSGVNEGGAGNSSAGTGNSGGATTVSTGPVTLTVTASADAHAISPLIYGVNPGKIACSNAMARFTMCRLGGNRWTTYNWENNASNAGDILCFQNDDALGSSNVAATMVTDLLTEASQSSATATITIPIIDYVAADKVGGASPPLCSGDVRLSTDYLTTRFKHNQARKGAAFADPPDATDANVSQDEFLQYVKTRAGTAKVIVTLDNQPELWFQTQAPVHPAHPTYQEVVSRNVEYASMVRDNWPGAEITGYGGYGYYAFLNLQDSPNPPGNSVFLDYYLAAMQLAETTAGKRLIDYLDIHWYSEVIVNSTRVLTTDASPSLADARAQAPRSLWDPSYSEQSWIADNYGPIRLIPWLKEKIATNYPNTKLAISEWSYGGENSISGAIAVADALGIFGREQVGLAAIKPIADDTSFALGGFAAFRNYDGAGAAFGDTSIRAVTSDVSRVSIYASTDTKVADRVVVVAINRSTSDVQVELTVNASAAFSTSDVFRITSSTATPQPASALTASSGNTFTSTLPSYSVSVILPKTG